MSFFSSSRVFFSWRAEAKKPSPGAASGRDCPTRVDPAALDEDWRRLMDLCKRKGEVAWASYDLLDRHIKRLDNDYQLLEKEILQERQVLGLPAEVPNPAGTALQGEQGGGVACPARRWRRLLDLLVLPPGARAGAEGAAAAIPDDDVVVVAPGAAPLGAAADADEPVYCYCQQISSGDMIACDNADCKIEWFHYECVGLKPGNAPKGRWLCPTCQEEAKQKKKGNTH